MTAPIANGNTATQDSHLTKSAAGVFDNFIGMNYKDDNFPNTCVSTLFDNLSAERISELIISFAAKFESAYDSMEHNEQTGVAVKDAFLKTYFSKLNSNEIKDIENHYRSFEEARMNSDDDATSFINLEACLLKYSAQLNIGEFESKAGQLTAAIQKNNAEYFKAIFPGEDVNKYVNSQKRPDPFSILACLELTISNHFKTEKETEKIDVSPKSHEVIQKTHLIVVALLNNDLTRQLSYDYLLQTYYPLEILTGGKKFKNEKLEAYQHIAPVIAEHFSMRRILSRVSSFIFLYNGCNDVPIKDDVTNACTHLPNLLSMCSDPVVFFIEAVDEQVVAIVEKTGLSWKSTGEISALDNSAVIEDAAQKLMQNRLNTCFNRIINFFNGEGRNEENGGFQCIFENYGKFGVAALKGLYSISSHLNDDQQLILKLHLNQNMIDFVRIKAISKTMRDVEDALKTNEEAQAGNKDGEIEDSTVFKAFLCLQDADLIPESINNQATCEASPALTYFSSVGKNICGYKGTVRVGVDDDCENEDSADTVQPACFTNTGSDNNKNLIACTRRNFLPKFVRNICKFTGALFSNVNSKQSVKVHPEPEPDTCINDHMLDPFYDAIAGDETLTMDDRMKAAFNNALMTTPKYYSREHLGNVFTTIFELKIPRFFLNIDLKGLIFFMKALPIKFRRRFKLSDLRLGPGLANFVFPGYLRIRPFALNLPTINLALQEVQNANHMSEQQIVAGQKLYNIVAFRKLMDKATFATQLRTVAKDLITPESFNEAVKLLSTKSYRYMSNNFKYKAPVRDNDNVPDAITIILGKENVRIRFQSVIVGGKCTTSGKRQEYLQELLKIIAYKTLVLGTRCGRFRIANDVRVPLRTNLLASHWKRTFNSMNEGWSGRIINALDVIIFITSFLFMFVGLIECYHIALHIYHHFLNGSPISGGDVGTAARLTSTAGAVGGNGMIKTMLMVIFTGIHLGMSPRDDSAKVINELIGDYDNNLCTALDLNSGEFHPEIIAMGNNELLDIVTNRFFTPFLERISDFRNNIDLMDTLTQYNWHLAITMLRSKGDPGNDYREPIYFQNEHGYSDVGTQTKNYFKKIFKYRKSDWSIPFNRYVYELLLVGKMKKFVLNMPAGDSPESKMVAAALKALHDEQRLSSVQFTISSNANNAALLRNIQLVASVFFVAAYVTPSVFTTAAAAVGSHGVAVPVLFIIMALFPHDFRGIFEGIYDLGFYVGYFTSPSTQKLNLRNTNVLRVMVLDYKLLDDNARLLDYGVYDSATFHAETSTVTRGGQDFVVPKKTAWTSWKSKTKKVAQAAFDELVRHANMLVPIFEHQELGIASGVWKTSYVVKILEFPGDVTRFVSSNTNWIDMANQVAQSIAIVN